MFNLRKETIQNRNVAGIFRTHTWLENCFSCAFFAVCLTVSIFHERQTHGMYYVVGPLCCHCRLTELIVGIMILRLLP